MNIDTQITDRHKFRSMGSSGWQTVVPIEVSEKLERELNAQISENKSLRESVQILNYGASAFMPEKST